MKKTDEFDKHYDDFQVILTTKKNSSNPTVSSDARQTASSTSGGSTGLDKEKQLPTSDSENIENIIKPDFNVSHVDIDENVVNANSKLDRHDDDHSDDDDIEEEKVDDSLK